MNIPFYDSFQPPVPKEQVKIEQVELVVYPDRFRVYVHVKVTPFQERPNLLIAIRDDADNIVTELNIIETMHNDMEFTLHIRDKHDPAGVYTLTTELFYETRKPPQDRNIEGFVVPTEEEANDEMDQHN